MNKIYQKSSSGVKNAGFTLIELLVVVLIIGILSSIALPQYTKAVKKARGSEAMVAAKAVADAQSVYYLANNRYDELGGDTPGSNLDIQFPELKYFRLGTSSRAVGSGSCSDSSSCQIVLISTQDQADLEYKLENGKLFSRSCWGRDCASYFSCHFLSVGSNLCEF